MSTVSTLEADKLLLVVDRVVVEEPVEEQLEGGLHAAAQLLPGRGHPLPEHGVVHAVPEVHEARVRAQQPAAPVQRHLHAGAAVVHRAAEGGALDLLHQLAARVEHWKYYLSLRDIIIELWTFFKTRRSLSNKHM